MPLITLTSDIGVQDFIPAAIKGQIMQLDGTFQVVDVTHLLSPFNYPQAAYVIKNVLDNFPSETFHLILVNLFDEKLDHLLIAFHHGQYIGCANNGLLTMILGEEPEAVVAIPIDKNIKPTILNYCKLITQAFKKINDGYSLLDLGNTNFKLNIKNPLKPLLGADWIEGQIIYIDNYENIIINIKKQEFEEQRKGLNFSIVFKRDETIEKISDTYADVPEGEKLAFFNSAGYLEIAINKGNAAGLFGLTSYSEKQQTLFDLQALN